jgi:hypothetical protein
LTGSADFAISATVEIIQLID